MEDFVNRWHQFYSSYTDTYVERDVRDHSQVNDLIAFKLFMRVAAAQTGQLLNYRSISKKTGISEPTIKSWINVLLASEIVVLIPPYHANRKKSLRMTPKLYPIEIKKNSFIQNTNFKGFGFLEDVLDMPVDRGCVLCFVSTFLPHGEKANLVPIGYL